MAPRTTPARLEVYEEVIITTVMPYKLFTTY